jgi:hypothetical protein
MSATRARNWCCRWKRLSRFEGTFVGTKTIFPGKTPFNKGFCVCSNPARGAKNSNNLKAGFRGGTCRWPPNYFGGAPGVHSCPSTPSSVSLDRQTVRAGPTPTAGRQAIAYWSCTERNDQRVGIPCYPGMTATIAVSTSAAVGRPLTPFGLGTRNHWARVRVSDAEDPALNLSQRAFGGR